MEIDPAAASLSPAAMNGVSDAARAARARANAVSSPADATPAVAIDRALLARLQMLASWDAGQAAGDVPSMQALVTDIRNRMLDAPRQALVNAHALAGDRVRGLISG
jgi:hypothetical protein